MKLHDILKLEGIVIRLIPRETVTYWRHWSEGKLTREEEVKTNSLGGQYLIQFKPDQGKTIMFHKERSGIGDTIENAYLDYINKERD